ncbi:MAG: HAD-IA family hydrolase [Casimicrobiaceae bacterium]
MIAFIFDIDGTIIDSMPTHDRAWGMFLARHGRAFDNADFFHRTAGRTGLEVMRELFGPLSDARAHELVQEKEIVYRELFAPIFREVAGFAVFARAAHAAGIPLGCATAGDAGNIAFALHHLGMQKFFGAVAGGHEVQQGKPAPDIFLLAAARMEVDPSDCVVFEDAPLGIEGAARAGMTAMAMTTTLSADELTGPHVIAALADYRAADPRDIAARAAQQRQRMLRTGT